MHKLEQSPFLIRWKRTAIK